MVLDRETRVINDTMINGEEISQIYFLQSREPIDKMEIIRMSKTDPNCDR